jgi:hypothetical protein
MLGSPSRQSRFLRAAFAGLLAVAVCGSIGIGKASAADEDEDTFEQSLIRQFMRGLGLKDSKDNGIAYQERAPLVLPPSRDLPVPESASAAARDPSWPVDPDVTRRSREAKQRAAARNKGNITIEESMRPSTPAELARNGRTADPRRPATTRTETNPDPGRPLRNDELAAHGGSTNLFSNMWSKIGPAKDEQATFTREPERYSLTAPPVGYRTPSAAQPYGVTASTDPNAKANAMLRDRAVGEVGNPQ